MFLRYIYVREPFFPLLKFSLEKYIIFTQVLTVPMNIYGAQTRKQIRSGEVLEKRTKFFLRA